jgi:hypothetical protein
VVIIIAFFAGQAAYLASEWWLSLWSRASPDNQKQLSWVWVYALLTALVLAISFGRCVRA